MDSPTDKAPLSPMDTEPMSPTTLSPSVEHPSISTAMSTTMEIDNPASRHNSQEISPREDTLEAETLLAPPNAQLRPTQPTNCPPPSPLTLNHPEQGQIPGESVPQATESERALLAFGTYQATRNSIPLSAVMSLPPTRSKADLLNRPQRPKPRLSSVFTRLRYPLAPPHPLPIGDPHPHFPRTLLHYHLLTEEQLDSFATYYHQRPGPHSPSHIWMNGYPSPMRWDDEFLDWVGMQQGDEERVRRKRRKVGRFIGLRECETPSGEVDEENAFLRGRWGRGVKGGDLGGYWGRRG